MKNKIGNKTKKVQLDETVKFWYCFTYSGKSCGNDCQASIYAGYDHRMVTKLMIDQNKKEAGVNNDAVLTGCMYLGKMTKADFLGHNAELSGQPQV